MAKIENTLLENMSIAELNELMIQVSTMMRKKLIGCQDETGGNFTSGQDNSETSKETSIQSDKTDNRESSTEESTQIEAETTESVESEEETGEIVAFDFEEDDDSFDFEVLPGMFDSNCMEFAILNKMYYEDEYAVGVKSVLGVDVLEPMDFEGIPSNIIHKVGNRCVSEKSSHPQWGRVLSLNGLCPTIMHYAPPEILVYNEIPTDTN